MAKLDFPPASSSPWKAPTGIIYTYIGNEPNGYWSASASNASEDLAGFFVETTGDNMTGNLTLGPDRLNPTLSIDASNGTVLTDGYFWSQQNTEGLGGCYLFNLTGASRSDAALMVSNSNSASFPTVALNYDGSAQFAQNIVFPSFASYNAETGTYSAWNVQVDSQNYVMLGGSPSSNLLNSTVKIKADGSASFSGGDVQISNGTSGEGKLEIYRPGPETKDAFVIGREPEDSRVFIQNNGSIYGSDAHISSAESDSKYAIRGDGSASFSGSVVLSGELAAPYANLNFKGGRTGKVFGIYEGLGTDNALDPKISLNNDGTAQFDGNVTGKNLLARCEDDTEYAVAVRNAANTAWTAYIEGSGSASFTSGVKMFRTAGDSSTRINIGNSDTLAVWQNDGNFSIGYDGSATFAGITGKNTPGLVTDGAYPVFTGLTYNNVTTSEIFADGSASFAGRVGINTPPNAEARLACAGTISSPGVTLSSDITNINATKTIQLNGSDGSATFGGNLQAADAKVRLVTSSNHGLVRVLNSSLVDTIFLEGSDGSASFAGDVNVGDFNSTTGSGILLYDTGEIRGKVASGSVGGVQLLKLQRGSEEQVVFFADGSAVFSDSVTSKKVLSNSNSVLFRGQSDFGQAANSLVNKFVVKADGSANFGSDNFYTTANGSSINTIVQLTGDSTSSKLTLNSPGNCTYSLSANKTDGSNGDFVIRSESSARNDLVISNGTGNASFAGTVSASNITAFKSRMASAVASAGDLAALKQAILDAVGDL